MPSPTFRTKRLMGALLVVIAAGLHAAGPASATTGAFELALGKDVDNAPGSGFERCTVLTSCKAGVAGAAGGEFTGPNGLAMDPGGNVYVAENTNERVQKLDASGNFVRAWGKNVSIGSGTGLAEICTAAADCKAGESGTAGGEFLAPRAIATDSAGNVYVADLGNHRIQTFDSSGNFLRAWGKNVSISGGSGSLEVCSVATDCKAGEIGGLGGELNFPFGLAVDPSGAVYVADGENNRIQKFDASGNFVRAWGRNVVIGGSTGFEVCVLATACQAGQEGQLGGEFGDPYTVAADSGAVYVADNGTHRIQKFDPSGNFVLAWGKNVSSGGGDGFAEVCTAAADCKVGQIGGRGGELFSPFGLALAAGEVYVSDAGNERIQRFDSSGAFRFTWGRNVDAVGGSGSAELCNVAASCQAGSTATALGGEFNSPARVVVDPAGAVWVADRANQRIQRFAADPVSLPLPPGGGPPPPAPVKKCKKGQKLSKGKCVKKKRKKRRR